MLDSLIIKAPHNNTKESISMPTTDFTPKILELEDAIIDQVFSFHDTLHISLTLKRKTQPCPACHALTDQVHDYRTSVVRDIPIMGKHTFLHYRKRRYRCPCCGKRFYEPFPLLGKYCRTTSRLGFYAIHQLRNTQNVSSVARHTGLSPSSVFRWMNDVRYARPPALPQVLSIDEFRGNAQGQKFQAILTDAKKHDLFDILPNRSQVTLTQYLLGFQNRKDVRFFIMDMNRVYKDIAEALLPNATLVIDRFHVVRYITWAVENVRKRIQKQMHPEKRKYFKRSRRILLSHKERLGRENLLALEVMLQQSHDLAVAYHLKELFYSFMAADSRQEAVPRLRKFILAAEVSDLEEFRPALIMIRNWSTYILNAFECPYSNGYTEGTNNKIKVIKRNAYGYRNFENFRNRIFLSVKK